MREQLRGLGSLPELPLLARRWWNHLERTVLRISTMRNVSLLLAAIAAVFATPLQAEPTKTEPSKTASCDDVQWRDARIAKSCVAVIERNGKRYVKLSGKVSKKDKDVITVLLDNSREKLLWAPDLGETVSIDGKEVAPMSVAIGQPLRFYVPEAQVAKGAQDAQDTKDGQDANDAQDAQDAKE